MSVKALLLATDLSPRCDRPLDRAMSLAKEWAAKVILLHVMEPGPSEPSEIALRDLETQIASDLPDADVDVEILVKAGAVAETIIDVAEAKDCDLIVTGVAHHDSISDILLGGPVDHLIRKTAVPVLVVKRRPRNTYRNILVASDFSECSLQALNAAADLFPEQRLYLIHAYHEPYSAWLDSDKLASDVKSEEQRELDRFLARTAITDTVFERLNASVEKGELSAVLHRKIMATQSDLVVLGTHGRGAIAQATIGSNAQHILGWVQQDVLIVREQKH